MSKFYVGQRVRLARAVFPVNQGKTGRVREFFKEEKSHRGVVNCYCDWDDGSRGGIDRNPDGRLSATHTDQLEPLIQPDNEATTWEELGFHPSQFVRESCSTQPEG